MLAKIKSFMNKIRKFYLFRKLVLSFLLFFVIALLFIVLIGAIYFEDSAEKSLEYVVSLQMDQAEAVVEQTVSPIVPVINSILSTHSVDAFFSSNAVDRVNEQKLLLSLRALQNSYEQIQNISLFSATNNRFLGTQGVSSQYIPGVVEGMEEPLGEMLGIPYFVRETPRNINIQNSPIVSTLTFVFRPRNYRADCAVIIDVQMAYLIDTIAEHIGEGTEVALLGMEGQPIIGKEEIVGLLVPEQLGEHDSMQLSVSMGRTIVQWRLMKQLACYVAVEIPYDQVMPYTNSLLSVSIIVCALFVLVGIVVTGILVNRIYNPIDTLIQKQELFEKNEMTTQHATVDEIKVFYAKVQDYAQRVQMLEMYQSDYSSTQNGNWIWHLLRGNVEYAEKTMRFTQWDSSSFFEKKFCVAVVVVDEYRAYCEMVDETGRKLNDFAMSNILEELLRPHLIESAIRVEENILAVVCGLSNTSLMEEMVFVLREFQGYMRKFFDLSISIGLGSLEQQWQGIPSSYRKAKKAIRNKFYAGPSSFLYGEEMPDGRNFTYPAKAEKKLKEAWKLKNARMLNQAVEELVAALALCGEEQGKRCAVRCVLSVGMTEQSSAYHTTEERLCREIQEAETLERISSLLSSFFCERAESASVVEDDEIDQPILLAKGYVDEHYHDGNLSVDFLANMVGLSAAYFGQRFASVVGIPCLDYITDVRVSHAAEMLIATDRKVMDISESVGIGNTNYFYILFKKKYGVTPTQYRRKYKNGGIQDG